MFENRNKNTWRNGRKARVFEKIDDKTKLLDENKYLKQENETMKEEVKRLMEENKRKNEEIEKLRQDLKTLSKTDEILELKTIITRQNSIRQAFSSRMNFIVEFIATLRTIFKNEFYDIALFGSFTRQIFEYLFSDSHQGYADCRGRDLDFVLCSSGATLDQTSIVKADVKGFFRDLKTYFVLKEHLPGDKLKVAKFGDYTLVSVSDVTLTKTLPTDPPGQKMLKNVPHLKLIFKRCESDEHLNVDLMAWFPSSDDWTTSGDFDVNSIFLDSDGISSFLKKCCNKHNSKRNFFDILNNIKNKKAACNVNLEKIHENGWKKSFARTSYLNELVFFIVSRWRKMAEIGYTMVSGHHPIPIIEIETKEPCPITFTEAPYPVIKFDCNCGTNEFPNQRRQSVQAYAHMVEHRTYKCPVCRKSKGINIHFEQINTIKSPIWVPEIPSCEEKVNENAKEPIFERPCLLSDEVIDNLKETTNHTNSRNRSIGNYGSI
jgi:hypothetical protein